MLSKSTVLLFLEHFFLLSFSYHGYGDEVDCGRFMDSFESLLYNRVLGQLIKSLVTRGGNYLLYSQMHVSSVMFIIQLPNVRVRLWRLWVKRRKRGRSGKLGGKSCLCFRTAKKGNLVVFPISVYPSLNNLKISAFSKVRYPNERREE